MNCPSTGLKTPRLNLNSRSKAHGNYSNIKWNLKAPLHESFVEAEYKTGCMKISYYTTAEKKLHLPAPSNFRYLHHQTAGSVPHVRHTKPLVPTYQIKLPPLRRCHNLSEIWPTKAMSWDCSWRKHIFPTSSAQSSVTSSPFGKDLHAALVNIAILAAWNSGLPEIHHLFNLFFLSMLILIFSLQKNEYIFLNWLLILPPQHCSNLWWPLLHQMILGSFKLYPKCTFYYLYPQAQTGIPTTPAVTPSTVKSQSCPKTIPLCSFLKRETKLLEPDKSIEMQAQLPSRLGYFVLGSYTIGVNWP